MKWLISIARALSLSLISLAILPNVASAQTCNSSDRSILLIMDASGSMNAKLPNGETRMAVAQRAVKGVASFIPAEAQLSLRLYGAQSPKAEKNCQDTNLAVPFSPAGSSGAVITATVDAALAQGYTPIAYSLEQAANDFAADVKERVIVLVSDGKETCEGDPKWRGARRQRDHRSPCGIIVDTAARGQLQAIAKATGGTYFDAPVGLSCRTRSSRRSMPARRRSSSSRRNRSQASLKHVGDLACQSLCAERANGREGRGA